MTGLMFVMAATGSAMAAGRARYHGANYEPNYDDGIGPYIGVSAGQLIYKEDYLNTLTPTIVMFHIGQQFNPFLAIEGRFGTGISAIRRG